MFHLLVEGLSNSRNILRHICDRCLATLCDIGLLVSLMWHSSLFHYGLCRPHFYSLLSYLHQTMTDVLTVDNLQKVWLYIISYDQLRKSLDHLHCAALCFSCQWSGVFLENFRQWFLLVGLYVNVYTYACATSRRHLWSSIYMMPPISTQEH